MGRLSTCGRHRGPALFDRRPQDLPPGCRWLIARAAGLPLLAVALVLLVLGLGAP
jgi:hypothetical protein